MSVQLMSVLGGVQPIQGLPGGLAEGLTGAVGIAILAAGAAVDIAALRGGKGGGKGDKNGEGGGSGFDFARLNHLRIAAVILIYFSGWLTVLEACHAREWWTGMITDPGIMFLVRLVALGLLAFLSMAVVALIVKKLPVYVAGHAMKKVSEHSAANQVKITPTAMGWAAVTALFSLTIPTGTAASNYATNVLNAPGTIMSATLIKGAAHLVGSDGQAPVPAQNPVGGLTPAGGVR